MYYISVLQKLNLTIWITTNDAKLFPRRLVYYTNSDHELSFYVYYELSLVFNAAIIEDGKIIACNTENSLLSPP